MALTSEVLSMISKKVEVEIGEIQDKFTITKETAYTITTFLVKFGFVEWDIDKKYVKLSNAYERFLDEEED